MSSLILDFAFRTSIFSIHYPHVEYVYYVHTYMHVEIFQHIANKIPLQ